MDERPPRRPIPDAVARSDAEAARIGEHRVASGPDGAEQGGSQAYVPPNDKDDKALNAAFNLLRGVTVNANAPTMAKTICS